MIDGSETLTIVASMMMTAKPRPMADIGAQLVRGVPVLGEDSIAVTPVRYRLTPGESGMLLRAVRG